MRRRAAAPTTHQEGNLQGCLSARYVGPDTNPLSHKSAKAERDSSSIKESAPVNAPPPHLQVNAALTYYSLRKYSPKPACITPQPVSLQVSTVCCAGGYECWQVVGSKSQNPPEVPKDEGAPNQTQFFFLLLHRWVPWLTRKTFCSCRQGLEQFYHRVIEFVDDGVSECDRWSC